jgi:xylulokinase
MPDLFLGLDSSTQSLSALVLDLEQNRPVYEHSLSFSEAFPEYGTENGVLRGPDPQTVHADPRMWLDALDALLMQMKADGVPLAEIRAVSGSGQQHGSVYLNRRAAAALKEMDPARTIRENLQDCFARETAPVWMDSSTAEECAEMTAALGGPEAMAEATGSTAFERFTGPQIRRFYKTDPAAYEQTATIALVSSFMASVLAGQVAPIDHGDGAGMNLMDIRTRTWHPQALAAAAPGLESKLPPLVPSSSWAGTLNPFFAERFGFSPATAVQVWSGDNPCSLIGLGLVERGLMAVSCGTSDTCFGFMPECQVDPRGEGHVFGAPTGDYMALICFKNGSLARERIKDRFGLDWAGFAAALRATPPGNNGALMLPWFEPEIVPRVPEPGVHRCGLAPEEAAANCRAVVEAQMMSMRLHSAWMGARPKAIYATGGGSRNVEILQVMADVHGCPVTRFETGNSAALGAGLRAAHAWLARRGTPVDWPQLVRPFLQPDPGRTARADPQAQAVYEPLLRRYAEFEQVHRSASDGGAA